MSNAYSFQLVSSLLTGTTTDRTTTTTASGVVTESFWAEVSLPGSASDTVLMLNLLTDPLVLVVIGDTGITFLLNAGGTDAIGADPFAVICNEGDGLSVDRILLSNAEASAATVSIIAVE